MQSKIRPGKELPGVSFANYILGRGFVYFKKIFIYLTVLGLSSCTWDLLL